MEILDSDQIPHVIPDWAKQLAELTRKAWMGAGNKCYFPYLPLTTEEEWKTHVLKDWITGKMRSWVLVVNKRIVSHAALVDKGAYWELGRLVANKAPSGGTRELCKARLAYCRARKIHARMECTQAHTRAQAHAAALGMRFAGIGFLDVIDGVNWDIIFFDTLEEEAFVPRKGVLANPLGIEQPCRLQDKKRLHEISHILSTDRGGILPPRKFHVLPELLEPVQRIIILNTSADRH